MTGSAEIPYKGYEAEDGNAQWQGAASIGGNFIATPYMSNKFLVFDPATGVHYGTKRIDKKNIDLGYYQWSGAVTLNGLFFGIPSGSKMFVIFDPRTQAISASPLATAFQTLVSGLPAYQWYDGTELNGRVYAFPHNARKILIWENPQDCTDYEVAKLELQDVAAGSRYQNPAVLNGKMYVAPSSANNLMIFDPATAAITSAANQDAWTSVVNALKTVDEKALTTDKWSATVAISDKIYAVPSRARHVLIYDPATDTKTLSTEIPSEVQGIGRAWNSAVVMNGNVYGT